MGDLNKKIRDIREQVLLVKKELSERIANPKRHEGKFGSTIEHHVEFDAVAVMALREAADKLAVAIGSIED